MCTVCEEQEGRGLQQAAATRARVECELRTLCLRVLCVLCVRFVSVRGVLVSVFVGVRLVLVLIYNL